MLFQKGLMFHFHAKVSERVDVSDWVDVSSPCWGFRLGRCFISMLRFQKGLMFHLHAEVSDWVDVSSPCWGFRLGWCFISILRFQIGLMFHLHAEVSERSDVSSPCWGFRSGWCPIAILRFQNRLCSISILKLNSRLSCSRCMHLSLQPDLFCGFSSSSPDSFANIVFRRTRKLIGWKSAVKWLLCKMVVL
jgi:hypothetical protein